jgi:hypothetical protein
MKFYINYNWSKIRPNKLTVIYSVNKYIWFFKEGKYHNNKNASYINYNGCKQFCLNDIFYGNQNDFTKKSWCKFARDLKLRAFL